MVISCSNYSVIGFIVIYSPSPSFKERSIALSVNNELEELIDARAEVTEIYFCNDFLGILLYISYLPNWDLPFERSWQIFDVTQWPPILNSDIPVPLSRAFQASPHRGIGHRSTQVQLSDQWPAYQFISHMQLEHGQASIGGEISIFSMWD